MTELDFEPTRRKPRMNAYERTLRQRRIMTHVQDGLTYDEVAESEGLTRERIRQIVAQGLAQRDCEAGADHYRMQIARLDPALRLAAAKVASGDLRGVDTLIKVLDRLDKYRGATGGSLLGDEDDAAKFDAKLDDLARRHDEQKARHAAAALAASVE
jgi:Sigma-70, region 4